MSASTDRFIINIDPHPLIGMQASVWVAPEIDGEVSLVSGRLTPGNLAGFGLSGEDTLTHLVQEAEQYTEAGVLAHFNRKAKVAKSLDELVKEEVRKKALVQHADRFVASWLERAVSTGCLLTSGLGRGSIIRSQLLHFLHLQDPPRLSFVRDAGGLRYRLSLGSDGEAMDLLGRNLQVLAGPSGWALVDRLLLRVDHVPAGVLKPFTTKEEVFVPEHLVPSMMRSFILKMAERADIQAEGFRILEHRAIEGKRLGVIQDLFGGHYKCRLSFSYGGAWFTAGETRLSRQRLVEEEGGEFVIHRHLRDLQREGELAASLSGHGLQPEATGYPSFHHPQDAETQAGAAAWLIRHHEELSAAGWDLETFHTPWGPLLPEWPRLEEGDPEEGTDWFDLRVRVHIGGKDIPLTALQETIREHQPFHTLPDGRCFLVPADWFSEYADWFALGTVQGETLRLTRAQFRSLRERRTETHESNTASSVAEMPAEAAVPSGLKATFRPYQLEGFRWLAGLYGSGLGGCLADDMGLGKTLQTIALLLHVQEHLSPQAASETEVQLDLFSAPAQAASPLHALVVAPSGLLYNWASEIARFAPGLRVHLHTGPDRSKQARSLQQWDVVVTSYALLVRDEEILSGVQWRCTILDESQYIKNKDSKTFRAVHRIPSPFRLTLTGTPVENSLADLWSQMQCINPGLLGTYEKFRTAYQQPIEKRKDGERLEALKAIVRPYILRRRKEEVVRDLPPLSEQIVWCEMTEAQERCYREERDRARKLVLQQQQDGGSVGNPVVLNALMRLRQIANHPGLLDEFADIPSGKFETLCAELETVARSGHKALVFSAFLKHLQQYRDWLDREGHPYDTITGEDRAEERLKAEQALKEDRILFLLMTLKAGGTGLNLTAADYVLLADPWWNPAVERQAIARAHRIGQERPVLALRFITRGTIEEKILRLQQRKQRWSDDLLEEESFLRSLDASEIGELLE